MNANVGLGLAVSVGDDLVIEEFGRNVLAGQAPVPCGLTGVAPVPAAGNRDAARYSA
ncbi:hypothetical protein ABZ829_28800 [Streptomyces xanthochromogenes]|uniref:hypothetical protein n=1 Tax=Streptomyces xanthochromogenes TaxID=67384 RepID=UPI001678FA96|nr:hypothetical protein [Streptomyces xanthochromogenes]GHB70557.1 hypothetical protein GCM10010331_68270 [Streptomyces xanthochromogenes]